MAKKVFISYRREDSKAEARSIYQYLERSIGRDRIFMDVDSIQKGVDFTRVLEDTLRDTAVMVVVIGRTWLYAQEESGRRRLDDPADYVRQEIATALKRDILIIPVRTDGARMPRIEELPEDIKGLVRRQGTVVTHENFDSDVRGLQEDLARILPPSTSSRRLPLTIAGASAILLAGGTAAWMLSAPTPPQPTPPASQTAKATPTSPAANTQTPAKTASSDPSGAARTAAAWIEAQRTHTFEGYRTFLRAHPKASRSKDAAEAAIPMLVAQLERRLENAIANAKRGDGSLNGYVGGRDPRVMAMCIEWAGTSYDTLTIHTWGSSQFVANTSMTMEEREKTALAFCNNNAPGPQRCTCEIVHRNGKPVLRVPQEWIARQLR